MSAIIELKLLEKAKEKFIEIQQAYEEIEKTKV